MKTITMILLIAAAAAAQDRSGVDRSGAVQSGKPPASAHDAAALPKGAVEIEPNLYRYTDAQGKTWLARRTPFGFSKWEDKPTPPQPAVADTAPPIKATDLGETVRFQRQTPFGMSTWIRKKSELTDDEKDWLRAPQPASKPQANGAPAANVTEKR